MATHRLRVYYEDTDGGGIVYYANYLKYYERARTEYLRLYDVNQSQYLDETGRGFVVRHAEVDYKRPAMLDDKLQVSSEVTAIKGAAIWFVQQITRLNETAELINTARFEIVHVQLSNGRPARLPPALMEKLVV